jgi:hypothetical protein
MAGCATAWPAWHAAGFGDIGGTPNYGATLPAGF